MLWYGFFCSGARAERHNDTGGAVRKLAIDSAVWQYGSHYS